MVVYGMCFNIDCLRFIREPLVHTPYQLTHDYLVPSLREWLTRKQGETDKGRAELKLAERAGVWGANRENKQLPTLWEWLQIRRWTERNKWTKSESFMMDRANRYHWTRLAVVGSAATILIASVLGMRQWFQQRENERAQDAMVSELQTADLQSIPDELRKVAKLRPGIDVKVEEAIKAVDANSEKRLKLSLALLGRSQQALEYVANELPNAESKQVPILVAQLKPYADQLREKYWEIAEGGDPNSLLQVASALAALDPNSDRWRGVSGKVVSQLVKENPLRLAHWIDALRPARSQFVLDLASRVLENTGSISQTEKDLAVDILESYVEGFDALHELIVLGEPKVFARFFKKYEGFRKEALEKLQEELARKPPTIDPQNATDPQRLGAIQRQANAAVALARLENPQPIYEFLTVDRDPEGLAQFIYRIRGREVSPSLLMKSFETLRALPVPNDPTKRQQHYYRLYGMLLGLGEYPLDQLPSAEREGFLKQLSSLYAEHPSRTIHSAVGWLLRRWGQEEKVRSVAEKELPYDPSGVREWYVIRVDPTARIEGSAKEGDTREEGTIDLAAPIYFTMIVYPGGEFEMGEAGQQEKKGVAGPFAVSDREVSWGQFSAVDDDSHRKTWEIQFNQMLKGRRLYSDEPVFGVSWFDAVSYCRWLTERKMLGEENQCYLQKDLSRANTSSKGWLEITDNKDWEWQMDPRKSGFRLLTEAEWEYVARGGAIAQFGFGTSLHLLGEYGWFFDNSEKWSHRTGLLRPSVAGLFDIHGNVWEWVDDWLTVGSYRLGRGGGWGDDAANCKSTARRRYTPDIPDSDLGFRIAQSPESSKE